MIVRVARMSVAYLAAVLCLALLLAGLPAAAYGYTDPGAGAFLYQAAYALFLGGSFYLRKFLNRIKKRR